MANLSNEFTGQLVGNNRGWLQIREFDWLCHHWLFADSQRLRAACCNTVEAPVSGHPWEVQKSVRSWSWPLTRVSAQRPSTVIQVLKFRHPKKLCPQDNEFIYFNCLSLSWMWRTLIELGSQHVAAVREFKPTVFMCLEHVQSINSKNKIWILTFPNVIFGMHPCNYLTGILLQIR